jgi:flavin-dependent dehydrogenase
LYDVLIVGSGPAGSTAAYFLGKQGKSVALIDKKTFPRPKPCGDAW